MLQLLSVVDRNPTRKPRISLEYRPSLALSVRMLTLRMGILESRLPQSYGPSFPLGWHGTVAHPVALIGSVKGYIDSAVSRAFSKGNVEQR